MKSTMNQPYEIKKEAIFKMLGSQQAAFTCDCNIPASDRRFTCPLELDLDRAHIPYSIRNTTHARIVEIERLGAAKLLRGLGDLCRDCLYNPERKVR